jgi:hypothetical protein
MQKMVVELILLATLLVLFCDRVWRLGIVHTDDAMWALWSYDHNPDPIDYFARVRNVSMNIQAGDRVALVGSNGAGKTTLLRVMAGIYEPVSGQVTSRGRISPMFDIGLGIDSEISGYENIRLRGLILGLSPSEIEERMEDIVEFTELGDYLDIPVHLFPGAFRDQPGPGRSACTVLLPEGFRNFHHPSHRHGDWMSRGGRLPDE